ncbi:hypothetical protein LTR36_000615 [Oleoguttula mirabilis]|uniref:F-box domain-containing protein n=1 Tax=Oleoguttula mirabilis TaxID=1507867 RepID=A0AAV9JQF3_9PEZI|nr:hypothetical protein LTR36_000615 [Oleoguttula mirabilis]
MAPAVQHTSDEDAVAHSMNHQANTNCRLLELPPELQLIIFELLVVHTEPIRISFPCWGEYEKVGRSYRQDRALEAAAKRRWDGGDDQLSLQPALSRVCKYIRATTLPIYYQLNTFESTYCETKKETRFFDWLAAIGPRNRLLLREVYIWDPCWYYDERETQGNL